MVSVRSCRERVLHVMNGVRVFGHGLPTAKSVPCRAAVDLASTFNSGPAHGSIAVAETLAPISKSGWQAGPCKEQPRARGMRRAAMDVA